MLDLDQVPFLDMTGVEILEEAVQLLRRRGADVLLARPTDPVARWLRSLDRERFPALRLAVPIEDIQPVREAVAGAVSRLPVTW